MDSIKNLIGIVELIAMLACAGTLIDTTRDLKKEAIKLHQRGLISPRKFRRGSVDGGFVSKMKKRTDVLMAPVFVFEEFYANECLETSIVFCAGFYKNLLYCFLNWI